MSKNTSLSLSIKGLGTIKFNRQLRIVVSLENSPFIASWVKKYWPAIREFETWTL